MSQKVKVLIKNAKYDQDNNLFIWDVENLNNGKPTSLSFSGRDFGINSIELAKKLEKDIDNFCSSLVGKEKNLNINYDSDNLDGINVDDKFNILYDKINELPTDSLINYINKENKESKKNES